MANAVYVQVNTRKLEEMAGKLKEIIDPTARYYSKQETYLKGVIDGQRGAASVLYDMVFDIKNGQAD